MNKTHLLIGWLVGWGGIGFYRGTINYYEQNMPHGETNSYTDMVYHGILGMFVYINPCFLPYTVYRELI